MCSSDLLDRPSYSAAVATDPLAEHGALFRLDGDPARGATVVPTPLARGPWSADALHGGAVASLFATLGEAHDTEHVPFVARLTVELMYPVPLAPMRVEVTTLRPGRVVEWVGARLFDEAERQGLASIQLDGQFIDYPIVARARQVLARGGHA